MIFETIKSALVNELDIESDLITLDALVDKDLELDSTENVVIALALKKHYGIEYVFPKEDISLGEIVKTVESLIEEKEPA